MSETTRRTSIGDRAGAPTDLSLPSADLGLRWRSMGPQDAGALGVLMTTIEVTDGAPYRTAPGEVDDIFVGAWKDSARDTVVGIDENGVFRAYGTVEAPPGDESVVRVFVAGGVHPQVRGAGVGRELLGWMTGRARQKLAESGKDVPGRIAAFLDDTAPDQWHLFEAAGYTAARFYSNLRCELAEPTRDLVLDPELRVVPWDSSLEDAARRAHNDAFRDHWGSEPATRDSWLQGRSMFAPGWSFVVVDTTKAAVDEPYVAGYLLSSRYEQDWTVTGRTSGYIETLGVRREYRGRKIAVALLAAAMDAYRTSGMELAELDVDADNPSGAFGLYSNLGFVKSSGSRMYSIEL
ncbi:GNAT family N-acetyltransferase [Sanguibacter antarcticus]|uniref:Acetyltransferase (GNAT) family protein n=1 Tax=Sanguibacter antarcticus TaxID=372484 RepID=A0A2A9E260_9MICO|nr:GNAT family N-acetyltransferase [Sanguibacter antarcticus]PFG32934.1 acetyltransferase (GNAT) family protein [Sanguibacter antarcticus]